MKLTGLVIQGARSSFTSMYITHFFVSFSNDGKNWAFIREFDGQRKVYYHLLSILTEKYVAIPLTEHILCI